MPTDLNKLSDEVLFYSNDEFYKFIEENLGTDEMQLIKLQSIKTSKTLINVPDVLARLSFKCKEIIELKGHLCVVEEDNPDNFVVKSGVQTSITDLITALKEKNSKLTKRTKNIKSSSTKSTSSSSSSSLSQLNDLSPNTSSCNSNEVESTLIVQASPQSSSIDNYVQPISDDIETFTLNTFENIILMNNDDYTIHLNTSGTETNGFIKCGCSTTIKIIFRSKSNSFQLSAYYKHKKTVDVVR